MDGMRAGLIRAALAVAAWTAAAQGQPVMTVTAFPDGQALPYLGNGIIGYRVPPNPFVGWKAAASGFVCDHEGGWETLAYAPYPFAMDFRLSGGPAMSERLDAVEIRRQRLDMSCGELTTEMTFPLGSGTARATVVQFLSRTTPVLSAQEVSLTVPEPGELIVTARIVGGPGNEALQHDAAASREGDRPDVRTRRRTAEAGAAFRSSWISGRPTRNGSRSKRGSRWPVRSGSRSMRVRPW